MPTINKITRQDLSAQWDEVLTVKGQTYTIGTIMPPIDDDMGDRMWYFLLAMGYYFVEAFLDCEMCGKCCRGEGIPAERKEFDLGVGLSNEEASILHKRCMQVERDGKHYIKYPCTLQLDNKCSIHQSRPSACRMYPFFLIPKGPRRGQQEFYILMDCPAAKELYIKTNLFMQDFFKFMSENNNLKDNEIFSLDTLEKIRPAFRSTSLNKKALEFVDSVIKKGINSKLT